MALEEVSSNMTVLSMHDYWLNFCVYMSLDELYWGVRCGYVQRVTQTTLRDSFWPLMYCTPCFIYFCYCWGMVVKEEVDVVD